MEKNARNQTDELIKRQKRKRLGQKQEQISFKQLPITWLSTKAQTILEPIRRKPYVVRENKPVKQYLKNHAITVSQKTAERIDKDIQKILTKSETEGTNSRGVAKHITQKFKDLKTWEAERIARTEINAANNLVSHNRLLESGLVDYKQWLTAEDGRVRTSHKHMNGEIARIGEPFSNGLQYPGDHNGPLAEFINCRCTIIPYIPDYDKIAPTDKNTWHEEDMQRLPTSTGQQITLQLQENMKLYQVMEGYMKLYPDKVTVKPNKIQTSLDKYMPENPINHQQKTLRNYVKENVKGLLQNIEEDLKKRIYQVKLLYQDEIPNGTIIPTNIISKKFRQKVDMDIVKENTKFSLMFPNQFKKNGIDNLKLFIKKYKKVQNEYGGVYDYITGKKLYCKSGNSSHVNIPIDTIKTKEQHKMVVIHNHPNHGPPCLSAADIRHLLDNDEEYMIVISENECWIAEKPKGTIIDRDKVIKELKKVEEEHNNSKEDIEDYTFEKYSNLKQKNNWKYNFNIDLLKTAERNNGDIINNELSNKKILEILNKNGIKTTRYIIP